MLHIIAEKIVKMYVIIETAGKLSTAVNSGY